jgi:SET domain-containing protein
MTPYEYIKKCVNVKLSPSSMHGVGVFAMRDIEVDEEIFINWYGETGTYYLTESEINSFNDKIKLHLYNMCEHTKLDGKSLFKFYLNQNCHWIFKSPLHWVNSCYVNMLPNIDKTTLKCIRKIKEGDELLSNYGKYNKFDSHKTIM